MNLPERFDLFCINEKGERERVVMIHAAIMGSIERFLSVIIEHFAGAFPFWLSPVQVQILTVTDRAINYANEILGNLKSNNIRVATDFRNESIGKKIREAELQKIPFILIIGDKEIEAKKIAVRERGKGDLGQKTFEEFLNSAK